VERSAWTDARLDDRFDRIDRELIDLRIEIRELRAEMQAGFAEVRQTIFRTNLSLIVAMIGLFATILARGA
jgi:hypothetical protein